MRICDKLFIDGEWCEPAGRDVFEIRSAHSEEVIAKVAAASVADIDLAVAAARRAFDHGPWPRFTPGERADAMARLSLAIQARSELLATTISQEMGAPISFSNIAQVGAALMVLSYFTDLARSFAFEDVRPGMLGPALVRREPVGVVGAIVPWNVPLFIIMLKLAPALAAGATVVLKPAPETALDAVLFGEAVAEAGFPAGVINIVPADREVGEHLVTHADVDKISFTGSTAAGRRIASLAGASLKRVTLELGGKSAAILLDDADLERVVPALLPAAMMNNGQACVAQSRWLVSKRRYDELAEATVAAVSAMRVGDPLDWSTECGPLASERQRHRVEGYIEKGKQEGARVAVGGGRPGALSRGWYVEPTVLVGVNNQMTVAREEIFGPVLSLIAYEDEADAIAIANDSDYGLSGSVWTADDDRGLAIARQVRTGGYSVNGFAMEFSAPFGGFKHSGVGRELGPEGLSEYLEYKTIHLPAGYEVKPRD